MSAFHPKDPNISAHWIVASGYDVAIARRHKPGVEGEVIAVEFEVTNSAIENDIRRVRVLETRTDEALMAPLIHRYDKVPHMVG
jgi:hypothetical protein